MAKYTYDYACGHGQGQTELFGKTEDRERKLAWMEHHALCPECFKAQKASENAAKGLQLIIDINPYDLATPVVMYFDGDTMTYKDAIKSLGYFWDNKPTTGTLGIFEKSAPKCWHKFIPTDAIDNEIAQAKSIGAKIINNIKD
ncbi:MAG: hypothetical protein N2376_04190, partial [Clostridia bacterium]|nr:hypothetical protein [Clostridia bacterium]